jgi:hypothetical protein
LFYYFLDGNIVLDDDQIKSLSCCRKEIKIQRHLSAYEMEYQIILAAMHGNRSYLDDAIDGRKGESDVAAHMAGVCMADANHWHFVAEYL